MAALIIDNATLSAVQRLAGTAPAPNSYDAQGDYSALENLFSSLLFFDDYYFVDDYKDEFRSVRAQEFNFAHPIPRTSFPYSEIESTSTSMTNKLILDVRGGIQAEGLLKEFLEELDLYVTCAWHMQSSNYFLTLKVLADEPDDWAVRYKYSRLTSMIFQQLSGDNSNEAPPNLINSEGKRIPSRQDITGRSYVVSGELQHFSNCLNWLARRTAFYTLLSSHFDSGISLHPIRHNFFSRWSIKEGILPYSGVWRRNLAEFFGARSVEAVNAINASTEGFEVGARLPLLAAWAVGSRGNVKDAISFMIEVSQRPEAIGIRRHLADIDAHRSSGNIATHKKEVNRLLAAIEIEARTLVSKYGRSTAGFAPSVSINAQLAPIPGLSVAARADVGNLRLKFGSPKHVRTLLRNVVADIAGFDDLGSVRSALLRNVKRSDKFSMPALRIEERRYFGRYSHWKEPM